MEKSTGYWLCWRLTVWIFWAEKFQFYLHFAFWTIDEWSKHGPTSYIQEKKFAKKAILFSQFEGFEFGSLAWKICEMVGKKKGFIFIVDTISAKRRRKAFSIRLREVETFYYIHQFENITFSFWRQAGKKRISKLQSTWSIHSPLFSQKL